MSFGVNETAAIDLLREELLRLLELVRGGSMDPTRAKVPFSVLLPDFGVNQAALSTKHLDDLEDLALLLLAHPPLEIDLVVGRASQTGNEANNLSLSEARARAVAEELDRLAVDPTPPFVGLGSSEPFQDIPGVESELNRSVEITLWYDLSHHFQAPPADDTHPAEFWRRYIRDRWHEPGEVIVELLYDMDLNPDALRQRLERSALIVQLVYDNINDLYSTSMGPSVDAMNAATVWQDDDLVRARALLGYYKQTGSDAAAIAADIAAFNALLRDNGLSPNDFTGEEISDAEHFVTGAVLTMAPGLGLVLGPTFSFLWEGGQSSIEMIQTGNSRVLRYNMTQFVVADMAGVTYGVTRTYMP